jgi:hypothetical protein
VERHGHIRTWSDTDIQSGETWREEIRKALLSSQVALLLVSADFLASDFIVSNELPPLLLLAKQQKCLIIPIVVGPCLFLRIQALQQFQAANSPGKPLSAMKSAQAEQVLTGVAARILGIAFPHNHLDQQDGPSEDQSHQSTTTEFQARPEVDALIGAIDIGDWGSAEGAALQVLRETDASGRNKMFEALLEYQDCPIDDNRFWGASMTAECCVRVAPWLIRHDQLARLADHESFSVRSTAASICMELANSAPERVPTDLLLHLSSFDEDWYVEAPAIAAIKTMAHVFPAVLRIFYDRLHSSTPEERIQAAAAIEDVAQKEPELLNRDRLEAELHIVNALEESETTKRYQMFSRSFRVSKRKIIFDMATGANLSCKACKG